MNKKRAALKELENSPALLALIFKEKNCFGVLFATKSQSSAPQLLTINVPASASGIGGGREENTARNGIGCVFAGIGNAGELYQLFEYFKHGFMDEHSVLGLHKRITMSAISQLVGLMNDEFRSADYDIGYSVEVIIVDFLDGKMFRIKYDGDFHYAAPSCIVGGYKARRAGKESVRKYALAQFRKTYRKNLPSLRQARKLAKSVLAADPNPGRYKEKIVDLDIP